MEKNIHRYSAYIPRWCQAFGDHAPDPGGEGRAVEWLVGADAVGVVVLPDVRRMLTHELLGANKPELALGERSVRLNQHIFDQKNILGHPGYKALRELLLDAGEVHMYLTYHLIHPPGTRIITISRKAPLPLLYKEMSPLQITVGE